MHVVVMLVVLALGPTVHGQSYDAVQLENYAQLCQQLRKEMLGVLNIVYTQILIVSQRLPDVQARIADDLTSMNGVISPYEGDLSSLAGLAKSNYASVVKATSSDPYPNDRTIMIYNQVPLQHGMHYSTQTGDIRIARSGVYFLELRNQGTDMNGFIQTFQIIHADGSPPTMRMIYTDWEISPYFWMLKLEAGDIVDTMSLAESSPSSFPSQVPLKGGTGNLFNLRYLGKFVPLGYTTTPAPTTTGAGTTPWWFG